MCILGCAWTPTHAEFGTDAVDQLFQKGRVQLNVGAGYGLFNDHNYFVLGLGAGYYLLDGLEAGIDGEGWWGSQPNQYNVSPNIRYIFLNIPSYKPYVGAFYRRTFYNQEFSETDSAGGRAGLVFPFSAKTYLTAGGVFEHYFNCDKSLYSSCNDVYPEIGLAFTF
jgi:hypothetical protein